MNSNERADISEERADVSEKRADASEQKAKTLVWRIAIALTIICLGTAAALYALQKEQQSDSDKNTCAIKLLLDNDTTVDKDERVLYNNYVNEFTPTVDECLQILEDV